jgi:hypothetical protein
VQWGESDVSKTRKQIFPQTALTYYFRKSPATALAEKMIASWLKVGVCSISILRISTKRKFNVELIGAAIS